MTQTLFMPPSARVDSLAERGVNVSLIAQLAFARAGDDSVAEGRHLALLPIESLELDMSDPAQRQFGDYELVELIGEGGMGVVYRARQLSLDREVAIKLLAAGVWASKEFVERFHREAQNAARMQHPNIVPVYEVGDHDGLHFFSMRLIGGPSLAAELKREKKLSPQRAAQLLRTIAEAVDYAHRLGVLHLDLKPANVLVDENGIPHVADFGLARRIDSALAADSDEVSGTPSYMAPEQASPRASRITRATDIWGLGAILYELVTGEPPFLAHSPQETLKLVVEGSLRNPRRYVPELPRDLEAIILKCMAYRVDERYASARDLADDLSRFLDGRAVLARPLNAPQRALRWARREPKLATAVLTAFAALMIGLAATTKQWRRADVNAQHALANAQVAQERLWDSRDAASLQLMESGDGWNAAPLLLTNVAEMEGSGARERVAAARRKLGILGKANPQLIDVVGADKPVSTLTFNTDATQLAMSIPEEPVRLYDIATGTTKAMESLETLDPSFRYALFDHLAYSTDGKYLGATLHPGIRMAPDPAALDVQGDTKTAVWRMPPAKLGVGGGLVAVTAPDYSRDKNLAVLTDRQSRSQVWATDPWHALSPLRRLHVQPGLGFVFALFAPDSTWFACTHHGEVELVEAATLQETLVRLPPEFGIVHSWAISPDSRWLVIGDHDAHVLAIERATGSVHAPEPQPPFAVSWFTFNGDGTRLAGAAGKGGVYLWRWPGGGLVVPPFGGPASVDHVQLDDSEDRVLVSGSDRIGAIWQIVPAEFDEERRDAVRLGDRIEVAPTPEPLGWHPASGLLADGVGALRISRLPPPVLKHARAAPIKPTTLHFDGQHLAAVAGNRVQIVDAIRETPVSPAIELPQPPSFAQMGIDGTTLIVVSGRDLRVYDAASGTLRFAPVALTNSPLHVELSPDGRRVATGWLDHGQDQSGEILELWDLADGHRLGGPVRVPGPLESVQFSARGQRLLAWSAEYVTLRDGRDLAAISGPLQDLRAPAFRKRYDLGLFALAAFDGEEVMLAVAKGKETRPGDSSSVEELGSAELQRFDLQGRVRVEPAALTWKAMLSIPASRELVMANAEDPLSVRDDAGHAREFEDGGDPGANRGNALAASRDGRWLARSLLDGVELFDVRDGKRVVRLHAPLPKLDRVWQLAFSPDGNRLLAGTLRNRWLVWDIEPDARPVAAIQRELDLRAIGRRESSAAATLPVQSGERAQMRARDPGPPAPAPWLDPMPAARMLANGSIPARSAQAPDSTLDLTASYNRALDEMRPTMSAPSDYAWLPRGVVRLLGVDFDVRGAIQLRDRDGFIEKAQLDAPSSVQMAVTERKVASVELLMMSNYPVEGAAMAAATLQYADGTSADLPIHEGSDLFHWRRQSGLSQTARLATLGYDARIVPEFWRRVRVYAVHLPNPHPERPLRALTLAAGKGVGASPVFFAVTLPPASQ